MEIELPLSWTEVLDRPPSELRGELWVGVQPNTSGIQELFLMTLRFNVFNKLARTVSGTQGSCGEQICVWATQGQALFFSQVAMKNSRKSPAHNTL